MPLNTIDGDMLVRGDLKISGTAALGTASIGNSEFDLSDPLAAAKQEHQIHKTYGQVHGSAATTERKPFHVARGAGSVVAVRAGLEVAAVGAATVTIDVRKNGTTILTAVVTLNSANTVYVAVAGAVAVTAYVAGDVFEVVVVATAGGGTLPQGVFLDFVAREAAD